MSGSVYVCDAKGIPLMPTLAAYARTLVQQHKAVLLPHPAVPLLQLSHAVSEPVLRPVLLGITVYPTTATALIFAETQGDTPLLSLTLDLYSITTASHRAVALTALARTLGALLPICQGALLTHQPVPNATEHAAAIHTTMTTLEACLRYPITLLSYDMPRMADNPLLFDGNQGHAEFKVGTPTLAFFVIISSTCIVVIVADLYVTCGPVSGTNYNRMACQNDFIKSHSVQNCVHNDLS